MCNRYILQREHLIEILQLFGLQAPEHFVSRYNLPPGEPIPAIRVDRAGAPAAAALNWGLLPSWAPLDGARLTNARAETLGEKPSFREAFQRRRCLLPASGFYEWEVQGKARLPWLFRRPDSRPFCLAGLWESRVLPDGSRFETCAIVTTAPNELMRPIHHRMPVVLGPEQYARWLNPRARVPSDLAPLLQPAPEVGLAAQRVGTRVNRTGFDNETCLLPPEPGSEAGPQFSLEFA
jgi:putative SOS response-associated peptidase YedK